MPLGTSFRTLLGTAGGAGGAAFSTANSELFNGTSSYLAWTPTTEATSPYKKTIHFIIKRAGLSSVQWLLDSGSNNDQVQFNVSDQLEVSIAATIDSYLKTSAVFRDPSAWYDITIAYDTTQATSSNRVKLYVNGTQVTAFATETYPSQNHVLDFVANGVQQNIGRRGNNSQWFSGYIARVAIVDGQALTSSSFGETDSNGYWVPIDISGLTFGTNGFYHDFTTAAAPGKDVKTLPTATTATTISGSGLFNGSSYLSWTPLSAGNRRTMTYSMLFKRGKLSSGTLFGGATPSDGFRIGNSTSGDWFDFYFTGATAGRLITTSLMRDSSAWYHLVVAIDTTQATASDRVKIYLNGVQITSFSTETYPAQNYDCGLGNASRQTVGEEQNLAGQYFNDGYIARFVRINGSALTPSSFGGYDSSGNWVVKDVSGLTFGTNGFLIEGGTAMAAGTDSSGNGNNFTKTGTVTATNDSPTGSGSYGNYCVWNAAGKSSSVTLSTGNTVATTSSVVDFYNVVGTLAVTEKTYWEYKFDTAYVAGSTGVYPGLSTCYLKDGQRPGDSVTGHHTAGFYADNLAGAILYVDGSSVWTDGSTTSSANDVFMFAYDPTNRYLWVGKNGTWLNSGNPDAGTGYLYQLPDATYLPALSITGTVTNTVNFGVVAFSYSPSSYNASTFKALATQNLSAPTVTDPTAYFRTNIYTGTGITDTTVLGTEDKLGQAWKPDFVWLKSRSAATNHSVYDSVRGVQKRLETQATTAEATSDGGLTAFNSGGVTLSTLAQLNTSAATYATWCLKASGTTASNTNGTITSTVSVAAHGGFSIVTYTGNGTAGATVGHGLSSTPKLIIVKERGSTNSWTVYHEDLGNTGAVFLDLTNAFATNSIYWNDTSPTSSVFSLGTSTATNDTNTFVAYCFADVTGFSKIGSYTGNGSTDGPMIDCGFAPGLLLTKRTDSAGYQWYVWDSARETYNPLDAALAMNSSAVEGSNSFVDFISTGFKIRDDEPGMNASGGTYIYLAIAETPIKYGWAVGQTPRLRRNHFLGAALGTTANVNDSPTDSSADSVGNYATWNPLYVNAYMLTTVTYSSGNRTITGGDAGGGCKGVSTISFDFSKDIYVEVTADSVGTSTQYIGIDFTPRSGAVSNGVFYEDTGNKNVLGSSSAYGATWTSSDVIGIYYDSGADTLAFYKNGSSQGTAASSVSSNGSEAFISTFAGVSGDKFTLNAGQSSFTYTAPVGSVGLATQNLSAPSVGDASKYFSTVLWTGTSAVKSVTGVGFSPDLVWIKNRTTATNNLLFDRIRGATNYLRSDSTGAEATAADTLTSFDADGFSLGADAVDTGSNWTAKNYVAWCWKGSGSSSSNTNGSITSTVSANTTSGFSIVTYTGTGANATVGHGLSSAPKFIIVKRRDNTGTWVCYHANLTSATYYIALSNTDAQVSDATQWNSTAPTSTVFSLGTGGALNTNGSTNVAYCFAEIPGFSKIGSYTGNGSTDGPFIYTGFRPVMVLLKAAGAVQQWQIFDSARSTYNPVSADLQPSSSAAEGGNANDDIDFLSNGFKIRGTNGSINSSSTMIYLAIADGAGAIQGATATDAAQGRAR